jgi:hypothetical protein
MDEISGNLQSAFSQPYLDLQKGFCCDTGNVKLIRWMGCKPSVVKGSKTMFSSDDLAFCAWFQTIDNYSFMTVDLLAGDQAEFEFKNTKYFVMKTLWEANSFDSMKQLEVGINQQGGVIGSTIPFNIESPNPEIYDYQLIRDVYQMNTSSELDGTVKLNNCSPYTVSVSILFAY